MKTSIYARAVAKAISFPDQIEIQYQLVDKEGNGVGGHYKDDGGPLSWEQVKMAFLIDSTYAAECEAYFSLGDAALIARPQEFKGEWGWGEPEAESERN